MKTFDIALLRRLLAYDPASGTLTWKARTPDLFSDGKQTAEHRCNKWNSRFAGKPALGAAHNKGYRRGRIFGRAYKAHRVAFALHHGAWPADQIDHINGDRTDNRIANLRSVDNATNGRNAARPVTNTSGHVGVVWHKARGKWQARINADGKRKHLGYFDDFDAACSARAAAEVKHGYHQNHGLNAEERKSFVTAADEE